MMRSAAPISSRASAHALHLEDPTVAGCTRLASTDTTLRFIRPTHAVHWIGSPACICRGPGQSFLAGRRCRYRERVSGTSTTSRITHTNIKDQDDIVRSTFSSDRRSDKRCVRSHRHIVSVALAQIGRIIKPNGVPILSTQKYSSSQATTSRSHFSLVSSNWCAGV